MGRFGAGLAASLLGEFEGFAQEAVSLAGVARIVGHQLVESFVKSGFLHGSRSRRQFRDRRVRLPRFPPVLDPKPGKKCREDESDEPAFLTRQLEH